MKPILVPIAPQEMPAILALAEADGHRLLMPSHAVMRDTEVIGAFSICSIPYVATWMHTKRAEAGDSMAALASLNDGLRFTGRKAYVLPCSESSPFFPHMARLGFDRLGAFDLFKRTL